MIKKLLLLSAIVTVQSVAAQNLDPSYSWKSAQVHVPGDWFQKTVDTVKVDKPKPVIVYLHGCAGIRQHAGQWARFLKGLGFIVVVPDSFALPGRPSNCDPSVYGYKERINVNILRPLEAEYALSKLKTMPWADKNNIFLMGHSEGGKGASLVRDAFKGVIISGYLCRWGVSSKNDVPLLALEFEKDPWFKNERFHCQDKWGLRDDATQILLKGEGHSTSGEHLAQQEVKKFLERLVNER